MAVLQDGAGTSLTRVDTNLNLYSTDGIPTTPAAGGFYTVSGWTVAVVAAGLAASVNLMSARLALASTRKAFITRFRVAVTPATLGAAAGVAGTWAMQRFTAQTPTGGTARTPNRQGESLGVASDITDIRDSNAALTGTAPTWGTIVAASIVPLFVANAGGFEWIYEPKYPTILNPGDGIGLRTQFAMAATQTWMYSYTMHWFEGPAVL